MIDHRFHCRPNRTVKRSAFLSSLGIKIRHVSFLFLPTDLATNDQSIYDDHRAMTKGGQDSGGRDQVRSHILAL